MDSSSTQSGSRKTPFCEGMRARDGRCVLSGRINSLAQWGLWLGYDAAYVVPLEQESLWMNGAVGRSTDR